MEIGFMALDHIWGGGAGRAPVRTGVCFACSCWGPLGLACRRCAFFPRRPAGPVAVCFGRPAVPACPCFSQDMPIVSASFPLQPTDFFASPCLWPSPLAAPLDARHRCLLPVAFLYRRLFAFHRRLLVGSRRFLPVQVIFPWVPTQQPLLQVRPVSDGRLIVARPTPAREAISPCTPVAWFHCPWYSSQLVRLCLRLPPSSLRILPAANFTSFPPSLPRRPLWFLGETRSAPRPLGRAAGVFRYARDTFLRWRSGGSVTCRAFFSPLHPGVSSPPRTARPPPVVEHIYYGCPCSAGQHGLVRRPLPCKDHVCGPAPAKEPRLHTLEECVLRPFPHMSCVLHQDIDSSSTDAPTALYRVSTVAPLFSVGGSEAVLMTASFAPPHIYAKRFQGGAESAQLTPNGQVCALFV